MSKRTRNFETFDRDACVVFYDPSRNFRRNRYFLVTAGCLMIYVGLRELRTNLKIRQIGVNLFKKLF
jgi:hypothetical protein